MEVKLECLVLGAHAQHLSLSLEFLLESMNALSWCSDYLYDYEQNGPSSDERDVNEEQNFPCSFCSSFKTTVGGNKSNNARNIFLEYMAL